MKEINVKSWEDFEAELKVLLDYRSNLKKKSDLSVSELLFRGQSDSTKKLETTLDRYVDCKISLDRYYRIIFRAKPQIETFTKNEWNLPSLNDYVKKIKDPGMSTVEKLNKDEYEYMAYIRHHGFPSPLLDWTYSPYLAAYFAINNIAKDVENISVYAYLEDIGAGKSTTSAKPWIHRLAPYVKTHARHFLQQSRYTVCMEMTVDNVYYAKHEDVFYLNNTKQDLLWKYNLPASERIKVLQKLDMMNINSYSLFGTEDSLMDMVAKREFLLKEMNL